MTQQTSGQAPVTGTGTPTDAPTPQVARDEAAEVGRTTADAGRHVAETAREQAGQVADEAGRQARDLIDEARGQVTEQARNGQEKAAEGLRALADELRQMADRSDQGGVASDLARQAADKAADAAGWLGRREPGDLVEEVRRFARRRPGAFLLGAAFAGMLVGRLTRGVVDANRQDDAAPGTAQERTDPRGLPITPPPGATLPPEGPLGTPGSGMAPAEPYPGPPPAPGPRPAGPPPVGPPPPYPGPPGPGPLPPGPMGAPGPHGPGGPGYGPPPPPPGPAHAPRPGATSVGEYVEELERGGRRAEEPWGPESGGQR